MNRINPPYGIFFGAMLMLLLLPCFVHGKDALFKKISDAYAGISSYQANLKQENHFAQIDKTISYTGNIYFSKGRMVIRFEKPSFQRLMVSGGMVELYDASSKTLLKSRMRPEFGKMNPVEILQLYWKKSTVSVQEGKNNLSQVSLKPFDDPLITNISASVNNKNGFVQNLSYTDVNGNRVTYTFYGVKTNAAIPASVWQYTYPKNIQVVEQ